MARQRSKRAEYYHQYYLKNKSKWSRSNVDREKSPEERAKKKAYEEASKARGQATAGPYATKKDTFLDYWKIGASAILTSALRASKAFLKRKLKELGQLEIRALKKQSDKYPSISKAADFVSKYFNK